MYLIELKKTESIRNKRINPRQFDYSELLKMVLDTPPQSGFTLKDIRERNSIIDAIEAIEADIEDNGTGNLIVGESEYKTIQGLVKDFQWGVAEKVILEFTEAVESARLLSKKASGSTPIPGAKVAAETPDKG